MKANRVIRLHFYSTVVSKINSLFVNIVNPYKPYETMKTKLTPIALGALLLTSVFACTPIKNGEYASGSATIFCDDGFKNILE